MQQLNPGFQVKDPENTTRSGRPAIRDGLLHVVTVELRCPPPRTEAWTTRLGARGCEAALGESQTVFKTVGTG